MDFTTAQYLAEYLVRLENSIDSNTDAVEKLATAVENQANSIEKSTDN